MAIVCEEPYELWDYDTGNCLGVYRTREEAERAKQTIVAEYGPDAPESTLVIYVDNEPGMAAALAPPAPTAPAVAR